MINLISGVITGSPVYLTLNVTASAVRSQLTRAKRRITEWFENYVDSVIDAVDSYCSFSPRSFNVTFPTSERIARGDYSHFISIVIESKEALGATALFELLNPIHALFTVNVQEYRFKAVQPGKSIYWTNEGECKYHDGGTYVDPAYVFHFNKAAEYEYVLTVELIDNDAVIFESGFLKPTE